MDINQLFQGFLLGNAAILTNACLLPLYPGLIAFLAGNANEKQSTWSTGVLGVLVLAGILSMMTAIGFLLSLASASFGDILPILLPIIYALVILLGVLMLLGRSPFARLQTAQAPMLRSRHLTAYVYGLFFGPMTLPCTGPIILTAFTVGSGVGDVVDGLLFFLFFGLGFGWPLVLLPLAAMPVQRRIVGWLSHNHDALNHAAGLLLIAVGVFGILTELLPQIVTSFHLDLPGQLLYWLVALLIAAGVGYRTYSVQKRERDIAATS